MRRFASGRALLAVYEAAVAWIDNEPHPKAKPPWCIVLAEAVTAARKELEP